MYAGMWGSRGVGFPPATRLRMGPARLMSCLALASASASAQGTPTLIVAGMVHLAGTPSDQLPDVLATGLTDVRLAFISLSAREPNGRDGEYIAWHSLDHR